MVFLLHDGVCLIAENENGHARTRSTVDCDTEFLNEEVSSCSFHSIPCSMHTSVICEFMVYDCSAEVVEYDHNNIDSICVVGVVHYY